MSNDSSSRWRVGSDWEIVNPKTGIPVDLPVLPEAERRPPWQRPLRMAYKHLPCERAMAMPHGAAETFAKQPDFYARFWCKGCGALLPVAEFVWVNGGNPLGT